jgi:hypothetical protein
MNLLLNQLNEIFRQRVDARKYDLAELTLRQILNVPGQPPEQYLYLSAEFYEEWGDSETSFPPPAAACYDQALDYRIQIGSWPPAPAKGWQPCTT